MIPYGRQEILEKDIQAVVDVLRSDFLTQGPKIPQFESVVSEYCGVNYGVAVNSGTSALHIACLALGVGTGDVVWTTPVTFVASANCARYCGADVDFVDIDPLTYNLNVEELEKKLHAASLDGRLPKVVIPVHLCGQSNDMTSIHELSKKYGFSIIEDACHALGGKYEESPVGNCKYSDITVFSFHPVKIITTAEGGMAVTNRRDLADKMRRYSSHGITRNPDEMTHEPDGQWYYQQIDLGFNYRMTDLQAALGISQFSRLEEVVAKRHKLAARYNNYLGDLPLTLPYQAQASFSAFHLFVIRLKLGRITSSHKEVFALLRKNGIGVNVHYIPIHLQPYYSRLGWQVGDYPEAERYYQEAISLPLYHHLSEKDQDIVIKCIRSVLT